MTRVFRDRTVLLLVLLLAFLIRFLGIFHDLPFSYYPDEEHFVKRSLAFGNGDFNPHWFNKPALYMYLLFFEYIFLFFFGKLVGSWNNINDYAIFYINHKGVFYFIGRLTTVSFGIGVIYLVYRIGKEFYDEYIGIISAVIVAFTFGHYESAIQVKADMPATFFTLASLLFVYRLYRQGRVTDYLLAGVLGGLGMATKYYSLALLFPFAVAHYLRGHASRRFSLRRLLDGKLVLAYFAFLGGFFLGSPFNFLDPTWAQYYILPRLHTLLGLKHLDPEIVTRALPEMNWRVFLGSLWHYGRTVVSPRGMGLSIGLLSLAGLLYCSLLGVRDKKYWVVVAFPWFFILLANYVNPYYSEPRHQLVVYPLLALCGAVLLRDGLERLRTLWPLWPQSAVVPYAIAAALVVAVPAWHIATDVAIILQPDPRTLAKAWIETHIPDGTKLVLDEYTPHLRMSRKNLLELYERARREDPNGQFTARLPLYYRYLLAAHRGVSYDIAQIRFPWWREAYYEEGMSLAKTKWDINFGNPVEPIGVLPLDAYIEQGYEYVITSTKMMHKLTLPSFAARYPAFAAFYRELEARGKLVKEFRPLAPHPRRHAIRIYRIGDAPKTASVSHLPQP